jgi:uncharacterized delta-60 repeat protein
MKKINISLASLVTIFLMAFSQPLFGQCDFDNAFGLSGIKTLGNADFSTQNVKENTTGLIRLSDGKILMSGVVEDDPDEGGNSRGYVLRLNADGSIDNSFGVVYFDTPVNSDVVSTIKLQTDGKIIVSGATEVDNGVNNIINGFVARLNSDGTFDNSFGTNGKTQITNTSVIWDTQIDSNGKILGSGAVAVGNNLFPVAIRLNSDGSVDNSYATSGVRIIIEYGTFSSAGFKIALQSDGKTVLLNSKVPPLGTGYDLRAALIRLNTDGTTDTGFGATGNGLNEVGEQGFRYDFPWDIDIDNQNNIVFCGYASDNTFSSTTTRFFVRRVKPNGNLDLSFDTDGCANFEPDNGVSHNDECYDLKILPNNDILLAGRLFSKEVAIVKFKQNGELDLTFNGNGIWKALIGTDGAIAKMAMNGDCLYLGGYTILNAQSPNDADAYCAKICCNTVSTSDLSNEEKVLFSPNPANNQIIFDENWKVVEIFDVFGKLVAKELNTTSIDVSNLSSGVYWVKFNNGNHHIKIRKMAVQH